MTTLLLTSIDIDDDVGKHRTSSCRDAMRNHHHQKEMKLVLIEKMIKGAFKVEHFE